MKCPMKTKQQWTQCDRETCEWWSKRVTSVEISPGIYLYTEEEGCAIRFIATEPPVKRKVIPGAVTDYTRSGD